VAFLFGLFDFNSLRSLSRTDIEFLVLSCCSAIAKIFMVFYEDNFVEEFVKEQFSKDERVNISQMLKWAAHSPDVLAFFALIGHPFPQRNASLLDLKVYMRLEQPKAVPAHIVGSLNAEQEAFLDRTYRMLRESG
jgi:hypothetical protein